MKFVVPFLFFLFIGFKSQAQIKVLFDATKAETANNADWVIDADLFNLGYNTTPYIGGNEANAQQTPTPSQAAITPTTSEDYWTGALSAWGIDAVKLGYEVETLPYTGSITYGDSTNSQDLDNYDIFIVCEPNILFTSSEKMALLNFVQAGGGLFMISDHTNSDRNGDGYDSPDIWNDFILNNAVVSNPFGITFDYEYFTEATTNIPSLPDDPLLHGTYGDVSSVEFYGGTTMTLDPTSNDSVKGVVYRTTYSNSGNTGVMCAYASYGNGRVVALGDSSPADDGTGDTGDSLYDGWIEDANGNHERLLMNATIWLAESNTVSVTDLQTNKNGVQVFSYKNTSYFYSKTNTTSDFTIRFFDSLGRTIFTKKHLNSQEKYSFKIPYSSGILYYSVQTKGDVVRRGKLYFIEE